MTTALMSGGHLIHPDGRIPPYLQIAQLLRQDIIAGKYEVGDLLPAESALSQTYGVSRDTLRAALGVLRGEGLLMTRRGAGTIVHSVPTQVTVTVHKGDGISTRLPTPQERQALDLPEGVWVLSVRRPGRAEELFDATRADIVIG